MLALLLCTTQVLAQTGTPPAARADIWDALPGMSKGTRLRLMLTDGEEVTGRLVEARTDAVVLKVEVRKEGRFTVPPGMSPGDPLTFRRSHVSSVERVKGWPKAAKVALWVGIVLLAFAAFAGIAVAVEPT